VVKIPPAREKLISGKKLNRKDRREHNCWGKKKTLPGEDLFKNIKKLFRDHKCDWLSAVGFYLASVLNGWRPFRATLNGADGFITHA
jgi:hypothetical protein